MTGLNESRLSPSNNKSPRSVDESAASQSVSGRTVGTVEKEVIHKSKMADRHIELLKKKIKLMEMKQRVKALQENEKKDTLAAQANYFTDAAMKDAKKSPPKIEKKKKSNKSNKVK